MVCALQRTYFFPKLNVWTQTTQCVPPASFKARPCSLSTTGRRKSKTQGRSPPPHRAPRPKTSIQFRGIQGFEDRLQTLRRPLLLCLRRRKRQRVSVPRSHTLLRRSPRQLFWKCMRVGSCVQFLQSEWLKPLRMTETWAVRCCQATD